MHTNSLTYGSFERKLSLFGLANVFQNIQIHATLLLLVVTIVSLVPYITNASSTRWFEDKARDKLDSYELSTNEEYDCDKAVRDVMTS